MDTLEISAILVILYCELHLLLHSRGKDCLKAQNRKMYCTFNINRSSILFYFRNISMSNTVCHDSNYLDHSLIFLWWLNQGIQINLESLIWRLTNLILLPFHSLLWGINKNVSFSLYMRKSDGAHHHTDKDKNSFQFGPLHLSSHSPPFSSFFMAESLLGLLHLPLSLQLIHCVEASLFCLRFSFSVRSRLGPEGSLW